jgi:hypothetical protein
MQNLKVSLAWYKYTIYNGNKVWFVLILVFSTSICWVPGVWDRSEAAKKGKEYERKIRISTIPLWERKYAYLKIRLHKDYVSV